MLTINSLLEVKDTLNWLDRILLLISPILKPERDPDLRREVMKKSFRRGLNQEGKIQLGYEKPLESFIRLYQILDKLRICGNVFIKEQIERLIHNSFGNKAFSHDL
ncbi:696_t:CDS:2 [Funneliformis mosseae]|uniref:696_t:CDS:1 n=1 Tax=Funneliformis mosseae TaxID=27381 RepID=A0A9N9EK18_FUNMO|nr:696_t:CDS:2 [Funneliformis mosseae]